MHYVYVTWACVPCFMLFSLSSRRVTARLLASLNQNLRCVKHDSLDHSQLCSLSPWLTSSGHFHFHHDSLSLCVWLTFTLTPWRGHWTLGHYLCWLGIGPGIQIFSFAGYKIRLHSHFTSPVLEITIARISSHSNCHFRFIDDNERGQSYNF